MTEQREILRRSIINRIAEKKNTIWGVLTRQIAGDSKKEDLYLLELYDHAHVKAFKEFLEEDLFNDLIKYNVEYHNKPNIHFQ